MDTDTGQWSRWITLPGGSPDWIWREDAITALPASHRHGHLVRRRLQDQPGEVLSRNYGWAL